MWRVPGRRRRDFLRQCRRRGEGRYDGRRERSPRGLHFWKDGWRGNRFVDACVMPGGKGAVGLRRNASERPDQRQGIRWWRWRKRCGVDEGWTGCKGKGSCGGNIDGGRLTCLEGSSGEPRREPLAWYEERGCPFGSPLEGKVHICLRSYKRL